jgi:sulfopropanediol 3-dehydrogenase
VPPAILYAAYLAGADTVLALGGVQALASMKHGLFTGVEANILVGPGSGFVAEAKMQLMGPDCGIDMFAGPTETCVLADKSADPDLAAIDLVSQAEHGPTSPCWFITTSKEVGEAVAKKVPEYIEFLPEPNRSAARTAWKDYGEVVVAADSEQMAVISDNYAPEHLTVLCEEETLGWWKERLLNYGSLFLGEGTCVTYGDKASGPNHTLPTVKASKVSGGLSVHAFLKKVTWQRQDPQETEDLALAAAIISRNEGMEGHAWSADARLAKFASTADKRKSLLQRSEAAAACVDGLFSKLQRYSHEPHRVAKERCDPSRALCLQSLEKRREADRMTWTGLAH